MTLREFLERPAAPTLTELSISLGVSKGRLSQLQDDLNWPAELALTAEQVTGGALSAAHLSPTVARARAQAA
jgi:DNA-binding transcriptional regulator YdaS (Cro superfamily)